MAARPKTPEEIDKMRTAGRLAAKVLEMIGGYVRPGVGTDDLDRIRHDYIVDTLDCIPAPLNYTIAKEQPPFPKSICTSVDHVVCHGIPSPNKVLKLGDSLNIDVTAIKDGYHGDTSKMFFAGKSSILSKGLATVAQECLYAGIRQLRPGTRLGNIGYAISKHARANRFSVAQGYGGQGIGTRFHDEPQVYHHGKCGEDEEIEAGMAFTIEPMLNAGGCEVGTLPDQCMVVTKDHKLSAQWEHAVLVTAAGFEVLIPRTQEDLP